MKLTETRKPKDMGDYVYNELEKLGYKNIYANSSATGYEISKKFIRNLDKAKNLCNKLKLDYDIKQFGDRYYLDIEIPDSALAEGVIKKYKGYTIHDTGDTITITDPHGATVGTERSVVAAEGRIDDLTQKVKNMNINEVVNISLTEAEDYNIKKNSDNSYTSWKHNKDGNYDRVTNQSLEEILSQLPTENKKEDLKEEVNSNDIDFSDEPKIEYKGYIICPFTVTKVRLGDKEFDGFTRYNIRQGDTWVAKKDENDNDYSLLSFNSVDEAKAYIDEATGLLETLPPELLNPETLTNVETMEKPQEESINTGLAQVVSDLIKDELEAIDGYNSAIVTFETEQASDYTSVLRDIIAEENNHIGQLQKIMDELKPQTINNIDDGQQEATEQLSNVESNSEDLVKE